MEKTRLTLDDLVIQSFTTTSATTAQPGTVRGYDAATDQVECPTGNVNWDTCWGSCGCGSGGNTDDCTVICYTDACSAEDCSFGCGWSRMASDC
jgi:hypothetical protein